MARPLAIFHAAATVLGLAAVAPAHEFWIEPDRHRMEPDQLVRVRLLHGERFAGDVVRRDDSMLERFEFISAAAATPVRGLHGHDQSFLRPAEIGSGTIVYQSREYLNVLPADRFEAYLSEEGLDEISTRRARLGETAAVGREAYVRCAKALVTVGDAESPGIPADTAVGLPLEIVLELSGSDARDAELGAVVLLHGEPVERLRVVAVCREDPERLIELVTDSEGRVELEAGSAGPWMLTTLHVERLEGRQDADWKSYWASLTFELPG